MLKVRREDVASCSRGDCGASDCSTCNPKQSKGLEQEDKHTGPLPTNPNDSIEQESKYTNPSPTNLSNSIVSNASSTSTTPGLTWEENWKLLTVGRLLALLTTFGRACITGYCVAHISMLGLAGLGFWPGVVMGLIAFYCLRPVYWRDTPYALKELPETLKKPWLAFAFGLCSVTGFVVGVKMYMSFSAMFFIGAPPLGIAIFMGTLLTLGAIGFIANSLQTCKRFYLDLTSDEEKHVNARKKFKQAFDLRNHPFRTFFIVLAIAASILATIATVGAWTSALVTAGIIAGPLAPAMIVIACCTLAMRFVYTIYTAISKFSDIIDSFVDGCKKVGANPGKVAWDTFTYPFKHPIKFLKIAILGQTTLVANAYSNGAIAAENDLQPIFDIDMGALANVAPITAAISSYVICAYSRSVNAALAKQEEEQQQYIELQEIDNSGKTTPTTISPSNSHAPLTELENQSDQINTVRPTTPPPTRTGCLPSIKICLNISFFGRTDKSSKHTPPPSPLNQSRQIQLI